MLILILILSVQRKLLLAFKSFEWLKDSFSGNVPGPFQFSNLFQLLNNQCQDSSV